jgi:hypothetical protein
MTEQEIRLQKEIMKLNFIIGQLFAKTLELARAPHSYKDNVLNEIKKIVGDHIDYNLGNDHEKS